MDIVDGPRRLKDRHFKMALRHEGRIMRAISWRGAERHAFLESHRAAVDVAFSLDQNQFNGETYLELTVCDIRPAEAPLPPPEHRRGRGGAARGGMQNVK